MLNRVTIMGRLVRDPELKKAGDSNVVNFSVAVERNYVDEDGERPVDFLDCVAWRGAADFLCKYFGKGDMVIVDGSLQKRSYEAQDGSNRYVVEILADQIYFGQAKAKEQEKPQPTKKGNWKK